jgi:hypothetical protein
VDTPIERAPPPLASGFGFLLRSIGSASAPHMQDLEGCDGREMERTSGRSVPFGVWFFQAFAACYLENGTRGQYRSVPKAFAKISVLTDKLAVKKWKVGMPVSGNGL